MTECVVIAYNFLQLTFITYDRILTLNLIAQQRREFGRPTYAAYVDLRSAFDSISRPALWLLLSRLGIPSKIIRLMKALYERSVSCVLQDKKNLFQEFLDIFQDKLY